MGVPGGDKGGAGEPTTDGQIGRWEEKDAGPADKNEAVALEPVIEDVKPSPLWRASYSDRHERRTVRLPAGCGIPGDLNNLDGHCGAEIIHLKSLVFERFFVVSSCFLNWFVAVMCRIASHNASAVTMGAASGL